MCACIFVCLFVRSFFFHFVIVVEPPFRDGSLHYLTILNDYAKASGTGRIVILHEIVFTVIYIVTIICLADNIT